MRIKNVILTFMVILSLATLLAIAGCTAEQPSKDQEQQVGMANPASVKCINDGGKLEMIEEAAGTRGICVFPDGSKCDEWQYFGGECQPGNRTNKDCPSSCPMLSSPSPTWCKDGEITPGDADECGCRGAPKCLARTYCTPESKKAQACTMEYMPVCGWYGNNVQCVKYPCAVTAGNKCQACATENVEYYTEGECPSSAGSK